MTTPRAATSAAGPAPAGSSGIAPADSSGADAARADVATEGPGLWTRRGAPPRMETMHRHDDVEINVVLRGELRYLFAGRPLRVGEGEIAVFWAAQPHGLVDSRPGEACWVHVPFATVLGWGLPEAETAPLLRARPLVVRAPRLAERIALLAEDWGREITAGGERIALLEIEASLRRILRARPTDRLPQNDPGQEPRQEPRQGPDRASGQSPERASGGARADSAPSERLRQVGTMAQFVVERHREPIAVADIAAAVHLTPSHAMTVFRRAVGITLGQYFSGGQRQRVLIARALLKPSPVLLVDEATSALDTENEAAITAALAEDTRPRTRVIVAHRLPSIRAADRVLFREEGRIVEDGGVEELLSAGGRFAEFWAQQDASTGWRLQADRH